MDKIDRRVIRSRRLLAEALVALVNEQTYEDITIRDITDRADVGYATFFRHYDGKDDLMLEVFTKIVDELEALPDRHGDRFFEQEATLLFQHIAENGALYKSILSSIPFSRKLRDNLVTLVGGHISRHAGDFAHTAIPLDVAALHIVASMLGLIAWWLEQEKPYSVERMAMVYDRLLIGATWYALDPDNIMPLPWEENRR